MLNVYLDPNSYFHLNNELFKKDSKYNLNDCLAGARLLRKYCRERGINLNTIDFWNPALATDEDIYVSSDHKCFFRKLYWKIKNRRYLIIKLGKFKKKVLFHFEPPVVMPEIRWGIQNLPEIYDKVFFTWKINNSEIDYFHTPQAHDGIFPDYWKRTDRGFLTIINSNRKAIFRYKELLTERIRAIIFFAQTGDIDLYGRDWDKPLPFPYWFHKNIIKKVYRGSVEDKYRKLSEYNFALAFENCQLSGYITEKIFDCFFAGTVPIYLGAPDIKEYIPENCFIDMRKFKNYEELRKFLKSLTEADIQNYKENGRRFLESEKYTPFTKEHFAKIFVEACIS